NPGPRRANGVVIEDTALPSYMSNASAILVPSNPATSYTINSTNPLKVTVPSLAIGESVTVTMTASASPVCSSAESQNTATAYASNASEVSDTALVQIGQGSAEVCDGKDNDCDGSIDEGADLCSDGNACNGTETCTGGACHAGTPLNCNDGNACTT